MQSLAPQLGRVCAIPEKLYLVETKLLNKYYAWAA